MKVVKGFCSLYGDNEIMAIMAKNWYIVAMILSYHGGGCIPASAGDSPIVFGPVSKKSKNFKPVNFGADVAFVSLNHPDMNGAGEAARGERQPFLIYGPGEYEVSAKGGSASGGKDSVTASGFAAGSTYGGDPLTNTIYSVKFDGLSVLYLGALVEADLPREVLEMDSPDVLIIPLEAPAHSGPPMPAPPPMPESLR